MKIGEIAKITNISIDTLRYYERIGLLPFVYRDKSGHRYYDESVLPFILFVKKLKQTNMPLSQIIEYAKMREEGDISIKNRKILLENHLSNLLIEKELLENNIEALKDKIKIYQQMENNQKEIDNEKQNDS